jgi:hypothetical protein
VVAEGLGQAEPGATAAPNVSTSAVDRHPYQGTAGRPGNIAPTGRSIRAKPLWTMARLNRPLEPGERRWALTDSPP